MYQALAYDLYGVALGAVMDKVRSKIKSPQLAFARRTIEDVGSLCK